MTHMYKYPSYAAPFFQCTKNIERDQSSSIYTASFSPQTQNFIRVMEQIESLADMDWSSLMNGMMYTQEDAEADFMAQLLSNFPISSHHDTTNFDSDFFSTSSFWPPSAAGNSSGSTGACYSTTSSSHHQDQDTSIHLHHLLDSSSLPPLVSNEGGPMSVGGEEAMNTSSYLAECNHTKAKHQQKPDIIDAGEAGGKPIKGPKKRSRATTGGEQATKGKKNVRSKKGGKKHTSSSAAKVEEESNVVKTSAAAAATNSCSEDESFINGLADEEKIVEGGEAVPTTSSSAVSSKGDPARNLNGKTRASRGAATDPQSLYARKRRERINERLKVLQTLVPNGTKVDISTMLEEAVQYVQFLQLQIKLLSSDDHWMYAPIAYNGMNIGLDLKIPQHM